MDLFDVRKDYQRGRLDIDDVASAPLEQLRQWLSDAEAAQCLEHSALTLSTVNADGGVSSRIVLLKKIDDDGLYIFTNYNSRKGQQLANHAQAAMLFFWPELERQVNIEGEVEKCSPELSAMYFDQRPLSSRVSALSSHQSEPIASRQAMDELWQTAYDKAQREGISCPPYWGGYLLRPHRIEFWQGGPHRFHDRILCQKSKGEWTKSRLMP